MTMRTSVKVFTPIEGVFRVMGIAPPHSEHPAVVMSGLDECCQITPKSLQLDPLLVAFFVTAFSDRAIEIVITDFEWWSVLADDSKWASFFEASGLHAPVVTRIGNKEPLTGSPHQKVLTQARSCPGSKVFFIQPCSPEEVPVREPRLEGDLFSATPLLLCLAKTGFHARAADLVTSTLSKLDGATNDF